MPEPIDHMRPAAIAQADFRASREQRPMIVYYLAGPDPYGRSAVWYVRPADGSEGDRPEGSELVYRTA